MISSGSPPKGNPKPPPSMRSSLAVHHLQLADQAEDPDANTRRGRGDFAFGALVRLVADQQETRELDVDVVRHDDRRVADHLHDGHRHVVTVELSLTQVELAVADPNHDGGVAGDPPATPAFRVA